MKTANSRVKHPEQVGSPVEVQKGISLLEKRPITQIVTGNP